MKSDYAALKLSIALLGIPADMRQPIMKRWHGSGRLPLVQYAPYTAYCLLVDVFFYLAVHKRLISPDRPSNRSDVSYLYYLPFAQTFVSHDKLHKRIVPLLMKKPQIFIDGADMKADMEALDDNFSKSMDEIAKVGLFKFIGRAELGEEYLVTRLKKHFGMLSPKRDMSPESRDSADPKLAERIKTLMKQGEKARQDSNTYARFSATELNDPSSVVMERMVPIQRGKYRFMPEGVENQDKEVGV